MERINHINILSDFISIGWKSDQTFEKIKPQVLDIYRLDINNEDLTSEEQAIIDTYKSLAGEEQNFRMITILLDFNVVKIYYDEFDKDKLINYEDNESLITMCLSRVQQFISQQ